MELDPATTIGSLLTAIPSSAVVFAKFGIAADGDDYKSVEQACAEHGIRFEDFLRALNEINWDEDYQGAQPGSSS